MHVHAGHLLLVQNSIYASDLPVRLIPRQEKCIQRIFNVMFVLYNGVHFDNPSLLSTFIHFIQTEPYHILGFPGQRDHETNKGNLKPQMTLNFVDTFWLRSVPAWHEWPQDGSQ